MKNVIGSLVALVAVVSLALSVPASANPADHGKSGQKTEAAKKKEPPKPKGPATSQGGAPTGQPGDKPATPEG